MANRAPRPPFIISSASVPARRHQYPNSDEGHGYSSAIGRVAGLLKIGIHLMRLPPGERSSWPHAEEKEEEFVYIVKGEVDAWINGNLHPMRAGDFAAFPSGTGISHCFLNNSKHEAVILVGGEASRPDNRIYYPLHPQRRGDLPPSEWWDDVPKKQLGSHNGMPDALRRKVTARIKKTSTAKRPKRRR
ncbi:MAG TPA: cupin domain-containing protein [Candidatus Binatus sp.]|nr:cupin domain-containing protein [Candidatus Binatus sp.]